MSSPKPTALVPDSADGTLRFVPDPLLRNPGDGLPAGGEQTFVPVGVVGRVERAGVVGLAVDLEQCGNLPVDEVDAADPLVSAGVDLPV